MPEEFAIQGQSTNTDAACPAPTDVHKCLMDPIVVRGLCCNVAGAATATPVNNKVTNAVITPSRIICDRL